MELHPMEVLAVLTWSLTARRHIQDALHYLRLYPAQTRAMVLWTVQSALVFQAFSILGHTFDLLTYLVADPQSRCQDEFRDFGSLCLILEQISDSPQEYSQELRLLWRWLVTASAGIPRMVDGITLSTAAGLLFFRVPCDERTVSCGRRAFLEELASCFREEGWAVL